MKLCLELIGDGNQRCIDSGGQVSRQENRKGVVVPSLGECDRFCEELPGLDVLVLMLAANARGLERTLLLGVDLESGSEGVDLELVLLHIKKHQTTDESACAVVRRTVENDRRALDAPVDSNGRRSWGGEVVVVVVEEAIVLFLARGLSKGQRQSLVLLKGCSEVLGFDDRSMRVVLGVRAVSADIPRAKLLDVRKGTRDGSEERSNSVRHCGGVDNLKCLKSTIRAQKKHLVVFGLMFRSSDEDDWPEATK
jgi:hypothetical protein